jgi:hypothetical protein
MSGKAPMTWTTRELPILEVLFVLEEEGQNRVGSSLIAERTGIPEQEVVRGVLSLYEAGYFTAQILGVGSNILVSHRLREKARREIGQWPADSFDAFVAALKERIAAEPDAEVKSRLQRLLDAVIGIGRDVATDVIGAAIKHAGGL